MRQDLLQLAESFLNSESIQLADKNSKVAFLRNKGLNDDEIDEAFKRIKQNLTLAPRIPPRLSAFSQIVYYPTAPTQPPRMTNVQLVCYALLVAIGTFGLTISLTNTIKKIMSKILISIANYQANRYKQTASLLSRIDNRIQSQQTEISLHKEQSKLSDTLDRLVQLTQQIKKDRQAQQPYKSLKSNIEQLTYTISQTTFTPNYNTFHATSGYSNKYQYNNTAAVQNVKSEIRSFKGMLLSRRNFPNVALPTALPTAVPTAVPTALPIAIKPTTSSTTVTPTVPSPVVSTSTSTSTHRHSTIPAPVEQLPIYHPRRKRSFRSELSPLVKDRA